MAINSARLTHGDFDNGYSAETAVKPRPAAKCR